MDTLREQLRWAAEAHETKAPVEELQSKEMKTAKMCLKVETLPAPGGKRHRSTETRLGQPLRREVAAPQTMKPVRKLQKNRKAHLRHFATCPFAEGAMGVEGVALRRAKKTGRK